MKKTGVQMIRRTHALTLVAMAAVAMLLMASPHGAQAQSPFTHSTKNIVLTNDTTVVDKYLSISVQAGLAQHIEYDLPNAAPVVGNTLSVQAIAGVVNTLQWSNFLTSSATPTQVAFWTGTSSLGGNNKLWWDSVNFRLGDGTNAPTQRLHVRGNALQSPVAGVAPQLQMKSTSGKLTTFAADVQTVDIPYTLPTAQAVAGTALVNNGSGGLLWSIPGSSSYWVVVGNTGTNPPTNFVGTTDSKAFVLATGGNERMRVLATQLVGLGTTAPSAALHESISDANNTTVTAFDILGHNSTGTPDVGFGVGWNLSAQSTTTVDRPAAQIGAFWRTATDASRSAAMTFSTTNSGTLTEYARIDTNGYMGVGTTDPVTQFDITGGFATRRASDTTLVNGLNNNVTLGNRSYFETKGPTGAFAITGFTDGYDGKQLRVVNKTGMTMTITDNAATSSVGNRIVTGAGDDIKIKGANQVLDFVYDATTNPPGEWLMGSLAGPVVGAIGGFTYAQKSADESVTNSAVLQNDDHLFLDLGKNESFEMNSELDASCTNNSVDIDIAYTLPVGATLQILEWGISNAGGNAIDGCDIVSLGATKYKLNIIGGTETLIRLRGIIKTGANAGTVQLQWCQDKASNNSVIMAKGSYMKVVRVL